MACGNASTLPDEPRQATTVIDSTELQDARSKLALNEPFAGNLSKYIPLPLGHTGPPGRGYLQFDACFEGGRRFVNYTAPWPCKMLF